MPSPKVEQAPRPPRLTPVYTEVSGVVLDIASFLTDCQVRNLAPRTVAIYRRHLQDLGAWLGRPLSEATTDDLRAYFLSLRERRNPGGQHQAFRVLRTFYRWLLAEGVIEVNPMQRLKAPRVPEQALDPVPLDTVLAMLKTCESKALLDLRDKAILLALVDTGARATELLSVNLADCDLASGAILLRVTKTKRPRVVFLGKRARRAFLGYVRARGKLSPDSPLWTSDEGTRLTYWGLRQVLRRRALKAGVKPPSAHAFRRLFCLQCLKDGMSALAVQALAGHADLSTTKRYVKWAVGDLAEQHAAHSPADRLLG